MPFSSYSIIFLNIKVLAPPLSVLTLEGMSYISKAYSSKLTAVSALLFAEQFKNVINREYPSIAPLSTKSHRIKLWWLSMCHKLFGGGTLYFSLLIINDHRMWQPSGSTRARLSVKRFCWTFILSNSNVLGSWSDHRQDHVYFDNPESNCPIHH